MLSLSLPVCGHEAESLVDAGGQQVLVSRRIAVQAQQSMLLGFGQDLGVLVE